MTSEQPAIDQYTVALQDYLRSNGEAALYQASLLSREFISRGLGPDEIVALHAEAQAAAMAGIASRRAAGAVVDALQFLLEVMIAYGVQHQHYLELRLAEHAREAEIELARERQRAEDLERADREKSALLTSISHELRTPITAARGTVQLIARQIARGQTDQLPAVVQITLDALDRLARLSNDLVAASRGEEIRLEQTPQDLVAILTQAGRWAERAAADKGLAFQSGGEPEHIPVFANLDAMLSIFSNLLTNAIRYTAAGGSISLRWGLAADAAWVEITDTGIGISPELQGQIFERFFRAPEARQVEAQGLGLGLALARQFVLAHDGALSVRSAPSEGSTFRVVLPVLTERQQEARTHGT